MSAMFHGDASDAAHAMKVKNPVGYDLSPILLGMISKQLFHHECHTIFS